MKLILTLLVSLFLITASPLHAGQLKPYSGKTLPDFNLPDRDFNNHTLSEYRGQVVLVNFWATYCPPCIKEMPSMQRLQEQLADKPFTILAINMAEEKQNVELFLNRYEINVDFTLLFDDKGMVIEQWMISAVPTTFIIDKQGNFRYALYGGLEWDDPEVVALINELIEE